MINLQRTLDNREKEIDVLENEVFESNEIVCGHVDARKKLEKIEKQQAADLVRAWEENNMLKVYHERHTVSITRHR